MSIKKELEVFKKFYVSGDISLVEIQLDAKWYEGSNELYYEVDGDVYSGELGYSSYVDEYVVFYLDTQQGYKSELILATKNQKLTPFSDDEDDEENYDDEDGE